MDYRAIDGGEIVVMRVEQWEHVYRFTAYEEMRDGVEYETVTHFGKRQYGRFVGPLAVGAIRTAYPEIVDREQKADAWRGVVLVPMTAEECEAHARPWESTRGDSETPTMAEKLESDRAVIREHIEQAVARGIPFEHPRATQPHIYYDENGILHHDAMAIITEDAPAQWKPDPSTAMNPPHPGHLSGNSISILLAVIAVALALIVILPRLLD